MGKKRKTMIKPKNQKLNISRQCKLLGASWPSYYYRQKPIKQEDLDLMRKGRALGVGLAKWIEYYIWQEAIVLLTTKPRMRFTLVFLARSLRLPDTCFNFLISGLVPYLTHQVVQSIESPPLRAGYVLKCFLFHGLVG